MTYFMTSDFAKYCVECGFDPKVKSGDKIQVLLDSILLDWDDFEEICLGDIEK